MRVIGKFRWLGAVALAVGLSACSNAKTVERAAADAGIAQPFNDRYESVKQAALGGLAQLRLTPSQTDETPEGYAILVARPPHGWSWGEVGRIFIEKSSEPPTTVRVVYEKRMALQFASSESHFARNLFAKMNEILAHPSPTAR